MATCGVQEQSNCINGIDVYDNNDVLSSIYDIKLMARVTARGEDVPNPRWMTNQGLERPS